MPADIKALSPKHADKAERVFHGRVEEAVMRIRMLVTRTGSPDGVHAERFEQGRVYDLPASLAGPYLAKGYAEEDKMVEAAPERKAEAPARIQESVAARRKKR